MTGLELLALLAFGHFLLGAFVGAMVVLRATSRPSPTTLMGPRGMKAWRRRR